MPAHGSGGCRLLQVLASLLQQLAQLLLHWVPYTESYCEPLHWSIALGLSDVPFLSNHVPSGGDLLLADPAPSVCGQPQLCVHRVRGDVAHQRDLVCMSKNWSLQMVRLQIPELRSTVKQLLHLFMTCR